MFAVELFQWPSRTCVRQNVLDRRCTGDFSFVTLAVMTLWLKRERAVGCNSFYWWGWYHNQRAFSTASHKWKYQFDKEIRPQQHSWNITERERTITVLWNVQQKKLLVCNNRSWRTSLIRIPCQTELRSLGESIKTAAISICVVRCVWFLRLRVARGGVRAWISKSQL